MIDIFENYELVSMTYLPDRPWSLIFEYLDTSSIRQAAKDTAEACADLTVRTWPKKGFELMGLALTGQMTHYNRMCLPMYRYIRCKKAQQAFTRWINSSSAFPVGDMIVGLMDIPYMKDCYLQMKQLTPLHNSYVRTDSAVARYDSEATRLYRIRENTSPILRVRLTGIYSTIIRDTDPNYQWLTRQGYVSIRDFYNHQLKRLLKMNGVKGYSKMNRIQLIQEYIKI